MSDIQTQLRNLGSSSDSGGTGTEPPTTTTGRRCPLCVAANPQRAEYDALRLRMAAWAERLADHEAGADSAFALRSVYDEYVEMVVHSKNAREQQRTAAERKDVVRYHSISYATFAEHFTAPHNPTRDARNIAKNDAIEAIYARHLKFIERYAAAFDAENNEDRESDYRFYSKLIKDAKALNDISVSARFLPYHGTSVRKSIHK